MTASGNILWSKALEKNLVLDPFLDFTGGIILAMEDGEIQTIDHFGNTVSYRYIEEEYLSREASITAPAAIASLAIDNRGPTILLLHNDRQIELIYPNLGYGETLRSRLELPSPPVTAKGRGDKAAVLMSDGRIALLCLGQREILWLTESQIGSTSSGEADILFDERGIYVLGRTVASAFSYGGERLWNIRLSAAAILPAFGDDGILYSGGRDWVLYAYRLEDRVRASQRLLYGERSAGSYGMGNPGPSSQADNPMRFDERQIQTRLAEIRQAIQNGDIGNMEREYSAWLMEIAGSIVANPIRTGTTPVHTQLRVEAARLLAFIGSRETIPFLANLFTNDPDTPVKAAAALAIGRIGVDPEGFALAAFQHAILPPFPIRDEAILTAVAAAIGSLCRFSGPPLSETGVRLLTALSSEDRPPTTRRQAQLEMRSL